MTHEAIVEVNYVYNVTPSFTLQPDVQGVLRPDGTGFISDALVLAVQVAVTF